MHLASKHTCTLLIRDVITSLCSICSSPCELQLSPLDVCWTSEGSPVWFTEGARLRTIYDALYKSTHHHHHYHHHNMTFSLILCGN